VQAEALRLLVGEFAFAVFVLGIIGTGLLAVQVKALFGAGSPTAASSYQRRPHSMNSKKKQLAVRSKIVTAVALMLSSLAAFGADSVATPDSEKLPTLPADKTRPSDGASAYETWAVHGQVTNVTQRHKRFRSPYAGANSLDVNGRAEETTDVTELALDRRSP
jgi:hypothetical protein